MLRRRILIPAILAVAAAGAVGSGALVAASASASPAPHAVVQTYYHE